jgi:multidrug efflux pump subunit AcrA (membrane-fusion protein)
VKTTGNAVGAVLLFAAGALAGWTVHAWRSPDAEKGEADEEAAPEVKPEDMSVAVVTAKAAKGDLPVTLPAIGSVRADEGALLSLGSRAGGRVAEVSVRAGDDVKRGAAVLRFDEAPLALAVAQEKAALATAANQLDEFERSGRDRQEADLASAATQAESDAGVAQAQLDRVLTLRKDGLSSEKSETEARQAAAHARRDADVAAKALAAFRTVGADLQHSTLVATRDAAAAALRDAQAVLAEAAVVAPADGRIVALTAHAGDRVDSGAAVGSLLRPDGRVLAFGVTPAAAAGLAPGATVQWTDAAGAARTATVRSVGADVAGPAGLVEIVAVPEGAAPQPGLVVRGEIVTRTIAGAVLVPSRAVVRAEDKPCVMLVGAGGVAKRVEVEVLGRHGDVAAVKGEVKDGDAVVVEGAYNLPDGAKTHEGEAKDEEKHGEKDDAKDEEKPESPK